MDRARRLWSVSGDGGADAAVAGAPAVSSGRLGSLEWLLFHVQRAIVWDDWLVSVTALLVVHIVYWLVLLLQPRFYFVFGALLLWRVVYTWWRDTVWPEIRATPPASADCIDSWTAISPRVMSAPELSRHLHALTDSCRSLLARVSALRQQSPLTFVLLSACVWLPMVWLGRCVSAAHLLYLLAVCSLTLPGVLIHCVPPHVYGVAQAWLEHHARVLARMGVLSGGDNIGDEFLPESSSQTTTLLEVAAGIVNGREPSPELLDLSAFTSGLDAPPSIESTLSWTDSSPELSDGENNKQQLRRRPSQGALVVDGVSQPTTTISGDGLSGASSLLQLPQLESVYSSVSWSAQLVAGFVRERLYGGSTPPPPSPRPVSGHQQLGQAYDESDFEMLTEDELPAAAHSHTGHDNHN